MKEENKNGQSPEKEQLLSSLRNAEEMYVFMSLCTKMPYVLCDEETFDDEVLLYYTEVKEDITYALDAIQSPVSLYEPIYTDGGDPLYVMDQISDKKNLEENWVEEISLREAMNRLPQRERHIIDLRFFEGKTQTEVAEEIHISQAQVSRLEKNALKNMRNYLS